MGAVGWFTVAGVVELVAAGPLLVLTGLGLGLDDGLDGGPLWRFRFALRLPAEAEAEAEASLFAPACAASSTLELDAGLALERGRVGEEERVGEAERVGTRRVGEEDRAGAAEGPAWLRLLTMRPLLTPAPLARAFMASLALVCFLAAFLALRSFSRSFSLCWRRSILSGAVRVMRPNWPSEAAAMASLLDVEGPAPDAGIEVVEADTRGRP